MPLVAFTPSHGLLSHSPPRKPPCRINLSASHQSPSASLSRRAALRTLAALVSPVAPVLAALEFPELRGLDESPDSLPPFRSVNGVQVQQIAAGTGATAVQRGAQVSIKYVMRRSNGYFIDASYGFDRFDNFVFRAQSGDVVEGFDAALDGLREGARCRFVVPPRLGYVRGTAKGNPGPIPPDFGARRSLSAHAKEPIIFEVLVVRVRQPNP